MDETLVIIVSTVSVVVGLAALVALAVILWRSRQADATADATMGEVIRLQADAAARLQAMGDMLAGRQGALERAVHERLDSVTHRLGQSMQSTTQHTIENLHKLHERLAVIDSAQKNLTDLAAQVTSLQCRARQQAGARRLRPGPHGGDCPGRVAKERLRIPVHALKPHASRLRRVPARPAPAGDRRQVSARSGDRLSRGAQRGGAQAGGGAAAPGRGAACRRHRREISDPGRDPGAGADVRALGIGLCRAARRLRRRGAEGVPRPRRAGLAVAAHARNPGGAADPARRPHARGRRPDPHRSRI